MRISFVWCRVLLVSLVAIFLLYACGANSKEKVINEKSYTYASMKDGVLHLDIDKARKDSSVLNMSEICDSLIYIPLQTSDYCLLGEQLNDLQVDGDDLFLHVGWGVYHFKSDGRFVCQIGKSGRGPGECVCTGLCVNSELKRVYVKANYKHKLLVYDYDGKIVSESISLSDKQSDMLYLPSTKSIFYTSNFLLNKSVEDVNEYITLSEYDLKGELVYKRVSKYFPDKFFVGGSGARMIAHGSSKYAFDASLFFQEIASDTVFLKQDKLISPHIILNNKDFKKEYNSINVTSLRELSTSHCVYNYLYSNVCAESSRFIFIDCASKPAYVYDKLERNLKCVKSSMYYNDLDGGNDFDCSRMIDNKYLYLYVPAVDMLDNLDNIKRSKAVNKICVKQFKNVCASLTEESNPVLVLARLKK